MEVSSFYYATCLVNEDEDEDEYILILNRSVFLAIFVCCLCVYFVILFS